MAATHFLVDHGLGAGLRVEAESALDIISTRQAWTGLARRFPGLLRG